MAFEKISAPTFTDIKNPTYSSGKIWFAGSFNGTDNLYAIRLSDKKLRSKQKSRLVLIIRQYRLMVNTF
jgi:hypothetical protein